MKKKFCEHELLKLRYDMAYYCADCKVTVISKELGAKALANTDWAISNGVKAWTGQDEARS